MKYPLLPLYWLLSHWTNKLYLSILRKFCWSSLLVPTLLVLTSVPLNPSWAFLTLASTSTSSVFSFLSHLPVQIHVHCPAAPSLKVSPTLLPPGQNCHQERKVQSGWERLRYLQVPQSDSVATLGHKDAYAWGAGHTGLKCWEFLGLEEGKKKKRKMGLCWWGMLQFLSM